MLQRVLSFGRGISALFFRSLRTESRSLRMHLLWFLLLVVIYFTLWIVHETTTSFGAPGLYFFRCVMYLNAAFVTLLGVSFFSTVISEEKEEDTLGLMTMAGISALGILLGKSTSRLFQVSLLLAIQYPFTLLAVTMGGLMPVQIASAYTSLLAYTILLANVGLLCSVACRTNRNASGLTTFWLVGYLSIPAFAYAGRMYLLTELQWTTANPLHNLLLIGLDWIARSTIITDLYEATETGHQFIWSPQIVSNTIGGLICFLLALGLFGFVAKEPSTDTSSRGLVARRTNRHLRIFSAGRAWSLPLVWKDFFFTAGGWAGLIIRCLLYAGLYALCFAANRPWHANAGYPIRWEDVTHGFQFFAHPLLAIDIALCASRVFHDEIRGQTLSSLLMLPESTLNLVYSKIFGCAIATLPGFLALALSFCLPGGLEFLRELGDEPGFWWWLMNLLFLIHLTAIYSLYLRSGAFVLALGTMIGTMIFTGFIMALLSIGGGGNEHQALLGLAAVGLGLICVACHAIILLRMPSLGQR
jgi:ABC-type transport system involved in multi-copper enzyme maturation permease subunit